MTGFKGYIKISENRYREVFGLDFEDFQVGQIFQHRPGITISQQDNKDEATETLNSAMLHYDAHYASQTEWKNCLGVSTLTLQKVLGSTWKTFYKKSHIKIYHDIAMTHPVFGGDTLYAKSTIRSVKPSENNQLGEVEVVTEAVNQKNEIVAKIHYTILIFKRGKYPEDIALPKTVTPVTDARFDAYHACADGSLMEQAGIYYEDIQINETYEHRPAKTFLESENWQHATRSLDWHPRFVDMEYVKKFHQSKMPISENYTVGVVTALTTRTFGRVVANLGWVNIEVIQPIYVGDTLHVESIIKEKRESKSRPAQGIMTADTIAYNQHGEKVMSYQRTFLIYKKGLGPYKLAGY